MSSVNGPQTLPVTSELFRRACSKFATGITVVTAIGEDGNAHGLTVNSFNSVSAIPPIVSVCIDLRCRVLPALLTANHFGINVLSDAQRHISVRFAGNCDSRFEGIEWRPATHGVPVLSGVLATFECRRHSTIEVGDHQILLGLVEHAELYTGKPLLFFNSQYCGVAQ